MDPFQFSSRRSLPASPAPITRVEVQRPLRDVLSFTRHSIDDVVNSPVAKARVLGYYKLKLWIHRRCELVDLERQWSGASRLGR